jgi:hypothetical protein
MKHKSVWATLLSLAVVVILAMATAPAQAVVGGTRDVDNSYSNVGMVLARSNGGWGVGASCTLVRNDAGHVAVLTAAHVAEAIVGRGGLGLDNVCVTFDPLTGYSASALPLADGSFTAYRVVAAKMHPDWSGRRTSATPSASASGQGEKTLPSCGSTVPCPMRPSLRSSLRADWTASTSSTRRSRSSATATTTTRSAT